MSVTQTFTGRFVDLLSPRAADISEIDIAVSLAHLCRFNGHVRSFYSVAQHSFIVSCVCEPADALFGLLHDAHEAYTGDRIRPIQLALEDYCFEGSIATKDLELKVQEAVQKAYGVVYDIEAHRRVKFWDDVVLATEARDVLPEGNCDAEDHWRHRLPKPLLTPIFPWPLTFHAADVFRFRLQELLCERDGDPAGAAVARHEWRALGASPQLRGLRPPGETAGVIQ
jgi:hypothetical protein